MLHSNGKRTCDCEVGKFNSWHACGKPAVQTIPSNIATIYLDYCEDHKITEFGPYLNR